MESDGLVRPDSRVEGGFDGGSTLPAAGPTRESAVLRPEFGSLVAGLQNLFANSGARIVANASRRVVWATTGAAALASGGCCIGFADGELAGRTPHSDSLLRQMFEAAQRAAPDAVELLIGPEPSSSPELFVRAQIYLAIGSPMIVLTIRSLAAELQEIPDLRHLYGLTRAEQKIVGMLIQGKSVTEVADGLHKSVLTIRSHLKRAYAKLDVSSKEQLFARVVKLMVN